MAKRQDLSQIWIIIMVVFLFLSISHFILASITIDVEAIKTFQIGSKPINQELIDYSIKQNKVSKITNIIAGLGYLIAAITAFLSSEPKRLILLQKKLNQRQKRTISSIIMILLLSGLLLVFLFVDDVNKKEYPIEIIYDTSSINWDLVQEDDLCFLLPDGKKGIIKDLSKRKENISTIGQCLMDLSNCELSIKKYNKVFDYCDILCIAEINTSKWNCNGISSQIINFDSSMINWDLISEIDACFVLPDGEKGIIKDMSSPTNHTIGECLTDFSNCILSISKYDPKDICDITCEVNIEKGKWDC